jgi:hypothetical protein
MTALPWYRHRWPWIIMSGPAAVLVAGAWTTWIAFASSDGLVAEDYYKQGLAINKVIAREEAARKLGVDAEVVLAEGRIAVKLKGEAPPALFVHLAHGTRAGFDQRLRLARVAPGTYEAALGELPAGRWRVGIEDPQGRWRVAKEAR